MSKEAAQMATEVLEMVEKQRLQKAVEEKEAGMEKRRKSVQWNIDCFLALVWEKEALKWTACFF